MVKISAPAAGIRVCTSKKALYAALDILGRSTGYIAFCPQPLPLLNVPHPETEIEIMDRIRKADRHELFRPRKDKKK
jgi:hypothetical protein